MTTHQHQGTSVLSLVRVFNEACQHLKYGTTFAKCIFSSDLVEMFSPQHIGDIITVICDLQRVKFKYNEYFLYFIIMYIIHCVTFLSYFHIQKIVTEISLFFNNCITKNKN